MLHHHASTIAHDRIVWKITKIFDKLLIVFLQVLTDVKETLALLFPESNRYLVITLYHL